MITCDDERLGSRAGGRSVTTSVQEKTWFGQPRGLTILFLTQMWEIFSYYGMRTLLVYYMTKQLLFAQEKSSLIYGTYTALAYFTPILGGAIADRWLGKRSSVIIGASVMAARSFHDGLRAAVLLRAGDDRAGQRPVPAEPAQPDQRPVPGGRSAAWPRLQRLLRRHQRRRLPRAADLRNPRRALWLALRLRRRRRRHVPRA